MSEICGTMLEI